MGERSDENGKSSVLAQIIIETTKTWGTPGNHYCNLCVQSQDSTQPAYDSLTKFLIILLLKNFILGETWISVLGI